jgi:hypothetical protein
VSGLEDIIKAVHSRRVRIYLKHLSKELV